MTLRLLGPFPPPFGGVALHLVRLLEALKREGVDVRGLSQGGLPNGLPVEQFSMTSALDRTPIHYHTDEGNMKWAVLLGSLWMMNRVPYILTVHSFRDRPEFSKQWWLSNLRRTYSGARAIVAISDDVARDIRGRLSMPDLKIHVIGSDLPISQWERVQPPPPNIPREWLNAPTRILANAGRIVRYNGRDLYGLDVLMKAVGGLGAAVQTLIVTGEVVDADLMRELEAQASMLPNVTLITSNSSPLMPLVEMAHVVVRPTRTEGGRSLTLSEALELGTIAVGSDAVDRPDGTVLFRNEDADDLRDVLHRLIANGLPHVTPTQGEGANIVSQLMEVYERSFDLKVSR